MRVEHFQGGCLESEGTLVTFDYSVVFYSAAAGAAGTGTGSASGTLAALALRLTLLRGEARFNFREFFSRCRTAGGSLEQHTAALAPCKLE